MALPRDLAMTCALTFVAGCPAENVFHESGSTGSDGSSGGSAPTTTLAPTTTDATTTTATDASGSPTSNSSDSAATETTDATSTATTTDATTDGGSSSDTGVPVDLDGWTKRRLITISNDLPDDLDDFQVLILVDGDDDMQADFADLRFANADVTEAIPYWIEYSTNPIDAGVWVRMPTIPANDSIDIWMYYGNDAAVSESDGAATMIFADDFESGVLDGTVWESTSEYDVNNGVLTVMSGSLYSVDPVVPAGQLLQVRARYSCCNEAGDTAVVTSAYAQGDSLWYEHGSISDIELHLVYMADMMYGPNMNTSLGYFNQDSWLDLGIGRSPGQLHFRRWYLADPTTISFGVDLGDDHYIVLGSRYGATAGTESVLDMDFDAIFVRAFATLEPTAVIGDEEDAP